MLVALETVGGLNTVAVLLVRRGRKALDLRLYRTSAVIIPPHCAGKLMEAQTKGPHSAASSSSMAATQNSARQLRGRVGNILSRGQK